MAKTEQVLSIFLASPGDVGSERNLVDAFVSEWNDLWSEDIGVHLKLVRWETRAYPAAGADAQDVINTQIGDEYDIFLGVMWKRFGTPTGRAASGTVEEFERAFARYRVSGNPQLMFYFKKVDADVDADADALQLEAVRQFRGKLAKEGLLYWEFLSADQFGQLVRVHLTRHVQGWAKQHRETVAPQQEKKNDLKNRYDNYLYNVRTQSVALTRIINQFAKIHLAYITANSRRAAQARAMTDETPDIIWKLSLIEMANEMVEYADAAEVFESSFIAAFSVFIEGVLGAAAVSIAFPTIKTKGLAQALVELRRKLQPIYDSTGNYIDQLDKATSHLSGVVLIANKRIIAAQVGFREHVRFGERLLIESEKLFNIKN